MVADLIRVDVRMAPLIDAALGELTQYVVVEGQQLIDQIAAGDVTLQGRVGIIDIQAANSPPDDSATFAADRAILGRADQFVEAEPAHRRLIAHLSAERGASPHFRTRFACSGWPPRPIPRRPIASRRAGNAMHRLGSRRAFVSSPRTARFWKADGRLLAGPRQAALGLVSRRSELAVAAAWRSSSWNRNWHAAEARIRELKAKITASEHQVDHLTSQYDEVASGLMNARLATRTAADRVGPSSNNLPHWRTS